jgi:hypothetical protein
MADAKVYDRQRNQLAGSAETYAPKNEAIADGQASVHQKFRAQGNAAVKDHLAAGRLKPDEVRAMARKYAQRAEQARKAGDMPRYARHAGRAMGLDDAVRFMAHGNGTTELSGETMTATDLSSISDAMCIYNPKGDEADTVKRQVAGISALHKRGNTKQAKSAMAALIKSKTSRARKMSDGSTRAHTPAEVQAGLERMGAINLSGGTVGTVDLAGDLATRLFPDAASLKKAAGKLASMPDALKPRMKAMIMQRAKALGCTVSLANELRDSRIVDLSVSAEQRQKAKDVGLTFPGTLSYPLAGPDGKFSRALADKAVRMVGLGNVGSAAAIKKWLIAKLNANGAADLIPKEWKA